VLFSGRGVRAGSVQPTPTSCAHGVLSGFSGFLGDKFWSCDHVTDRGFVVSLVGGLPDLRPVGSFSGIRKHSNAAFKETLF
jgi:hypothetical protein